MITLLATLKALPGKENELNEICIGLAQKVQANEPGCLMYVPHSSKDDPAEITFIEKYKDQQAFKEHGKTAYFQEAFSKFKDLAGPLQVKFLEELQVYVCNQLVIKEQPLVAP